MKVSRLCAVSNIKAISNTFGEIKNILKSKLLEITDKI